MILPSGDIVPPELLPGRVGFQVIKNNDIAYSELYVKPVIGHDFR